MTSHALSTLYENARVRSNPGAVLPTPLADAGNTLHSDKVEVASCPESVRGWKWRLRREALLI